MNRHCCSCRLPHSATLTSRRQPGTPFVERKQVSLDLLTLSGAPTWEVRVTAITNVVFGLSCLAWLVSLTYLARKFRDLPVRAAYLAFGGLLGVTATIQFAQSLELLSATAWVASSLRVLKAVCAVGTVVLLGSVIVQIDSLLARERGALQRESDLTAVLKELSTAYARLQNLDELKTQVFANVSHELRTPLTLILGPIQDLREAAWAQPRAARLAGGGRAQRAAAARARQRSAGAVAR